MTTTIATQHALTEAMSKDGGPLDLELAPGRYELPPVNRAVTLRGPREAILFGQPGQAAVAASEAAELTLEGITVSASEDGQGVVALGQSRVALLNVSVVGGAHGIQALGATGVRAKGVEVRGATACGVEVRARAALELHDVRIETAKGIALSQRDLAKLSATACTILGNHERDAVTIATGYDVVIEGCSVRGGHRGVVVSGGRGGVLRNCSVVGSLWPCLVVEDVIAGRPVDALAVDGCSFRGSEKSSGIVASDVPSSRRPLVTLVDCTSEGHFGWGAVGKTGAVIELRGGRYGGAHGGLRAVGHGVVLAKDLDVQEGPIGLSAATGGTILAEDIRAAGELTDAVRVDTKGAIRWRGGQLEATRAFSVNGDGWVALAKVDVTTHAGALEVPWGNALVIDCNGLDKTDDSTTLGYGNLWIARGSAPEPTVGEGGAVVHATVSPEAPREDWRSLDDATLREWLERLSELGFDADDATIGKVIEALGWAVDDGAPRSSTLTMARDNAGWFDQLALFALLDPIDLPKATSPKHPRIGVMLSELDALIPEADGHPVVMRAGASPEAIAATAKQLGLEALPPELEVWFAWHDGQDPDSKGLFKPGYHNRPLSLAEMTTAWLELTGDPEHVPSLRATQIPLLETKEGFIAFDLDGSKHWSAGALVEIDRGERDVKGQFECFAEWLEGVLMRRRAEVGSRELSVAAPDPAPTQAQQIVLATAAQLLTRNDDRADVLGGVRPVVGTPRAYRQLRYWWDIYTTRDARSTVEGLLEEGRSQLDDDAPDAELAWTLGRAAMVAGTAYAAMLVEREDAWTWSLAAARLLRERFDSWESFGDAYNAARIEWSGGLGDEHRTASDAVAEARGPFDRAYARLLTEGAWSRLPWELPDDDPPCPATAAPPRTWSVTPDGRDDTSTLEDALREAQPGDRLELATGHYRGGHDLVGYVTVAGVGEGVVIDSPTGKACLSVLGGVPIARERHPPRRSSATWVRPLCTERGQRHALRQELPSARGRHRPPPLRRLRETRRL